MPNLVKKVIKGLECHAEVDCAECPYNVDWRTCPFGDTLLVDALTLIKEQERIRKFYVEKCDELYSIAKNKVEIVRCKDCTQNNQCSIQFKFADADNPGNWFCADGKRKEGR